MLRTRVLPLGLLLAGLANAAAAGTVIHACEGPRGRLRIVDESGVCRRNEQPLAWQRHGGVRVFDASGVDLGRLAPKTDSLNLVWNDEADVAYQVDRRSGQIIDFTFASLTFFDEPDCQGRAIIGVGGFEPPVGALVPDERTPGALWVVTGAAPLDFPVASRFDGRCQPWQFPPFGGGATVEPFQGTLEVSFPVEGPLRVGSDLPVSAGTTGILHACIGPSGRLRRASSPDDCRTNERPDAWLPLGGPRVFDAEGRELGLLLGTGRVYHPGEDLWFRLLPNEGGLFPKSLSFSGADCTGQALTDDIGLGELFQTGDPVHPLYVARGPVLAQARGRSFRGVDGVCHAFAFGPVRAAVAEPFTGDLGFTFPVPPPVVPGFPGSPLAEPDGDAPGTGVFHACVGPTGRLRAADGAGACVPAESSLAWERRGGLRVFDAAGTDLGALTTPSAALDDESGLRFGLHFLSARFDEDPILSIPANLFFDELECRGRAFVDQPWAGLVVERQAVPPGYFAGTTRLVTARASRSILFSGQDCEAFVRNVPLGLELEPFDALPFALPLAAPLRIEPALR